MRDDAFYRYVYKSNNGFIIKKNNENYGWYDDIRIALYDRDRLEQVGWDIQTWTELPEVPNPYMHMHLPKYEHTARYITEISERYIVFRGRKYVAVFDNEEDAFKYAKEKGLKVIYQKARYRVQKRINGKLYSKSCKTFEEALELRNKLMDNGWNYDLFT